MTSESVYVLDSDVFIDAKNLYYSFDLCPGFWESILHHYSLGDLVSIDRVRSELLQGHKTEDLVVWVKNEVPDGFFKSVDEDAIATRYQQIMLWAQRSTQYFDAAKAKFASGADGWLVAYASVKGATVVTNEQPAPSAKTNIKLPDVCD